MSDLERDDRLDQVALYALGVLAQPEANEAAALIARDPEARAAYDELRGTVDAVGLIAEEPVDSARAARMRERLLARVRNDDVVTLTPRSRIAMFRAAIWASGLAAAASFIFALATVAQDLTLRGDLAATQRRATALQAQLVARERIAEQRRQLLTDVLASDAKRYTIPQGTVIVRGPRMYLALSKLPPLPHGRVYEAWTAVKGTTTMMPSGTFTPSEGVTIVPLSVNAERIGVVAVSVEPAGGSKAPTTKPTFVRTLS
jgi:anti-sigma-K factor RskA